MSTRYAVPVEVQELDKKQRAQKEDDDVRRFREKYLNPNRVVTDIPADLQQPPKEEGEESEESEEEEKPKDPRKHVCDCMARCNWV